MSGKKLKNPIRKSPAPGKNDTKGQYGGNEYAYGSQLDADSVTELGPESHATDTPAKPSYNQSSKSPRAKKQKSATKSSVNFGDRIVSAANNETNAHYSANRELDALEYSARGNAQGMGADEVKDSLIISTGNMTKNGKTINYMIREYDKKCYCVQLYVPLTDQKWMVFVPLTESLSELLHVWERSRTSPDQLAKLGAWLLSCTTLEFDSDNYLIVAAFFDHKTFREKYVSRIMDTLAGEHNLSPSNSPPKGMNIEDHQQHYNHQQQFGHSQGPFGGFGQGQGEQGQSSKKQWFRTRDSSPEGFIRTPSVSYQSMSTPNAAISHGYGYGPGHASTGSTGNYNPAASSETPQSARSAVNFNQSDMESSQVTATGSQESSFVFPSSGTGKKKDAMKEQKDLMMRTYLGSKGIEAQLGVVVKHSGGRDPNSKSTSATTSHPGYNPRASTALQQYLSSQMTKKELHNEIISLKMEISEVFDSFHGSIMQLRQELQENTGRQMQYAEIQEQLIRLSGRSNAEIMGLDNISQQLQSQGQLEGSQDSQSLAPLNIDANDSVSNIAASFSVGVVPTATGNSSGPGLNKSASKAEMDTLKGDLLMLMTKMTALEEILQQNVRAQTQGGSGANGVAGGGVAMSDPLREQYQAELGQLLELKRNFSGNLNAQANNIKNNNPSALSAENQQHQSKIINNEVHSVKTGGHSLLKDRDGSLLAIDGVSVDKSVVKPPDSVYRLTKPPKPRKSKYTKPYGPNVAGHIMQSLARAFLFRKRRQDSNGSATNTGWVREATLLGVISRTTEYYIMCAAFRFCLTTSNLILVRKTLNRMIDLIKVTDSSDVVTHIPLDLVVRVLNVFVHVPLITELGYDVFAVLCKSFEENATNNVASWAHVASAGSGAVTDLINEQGSTFDTALSVDDVKVQDSIMASGGCEFVVQTLDNHIADPKLCFKGVKCIFLMCNSNANVKQIFSTNKCMKMLSKVLNKHKLNQSVIEGVLRAVCAVGAGDLDNKNRIANVGLLGAIINCLKYHYKSDRSMMLFTRTITVLVENHEQNQLASSGPVGSQLYSDMLVYHASKGRSVDKIIFLIQAHYKDNEQAKHHFIDNGMINALKQVIDCPDTNHRALMAVYTLAPNILCTCWNTHRPVVADFVEFLKARVDNYRNSAETKRMIMYCLAKFQEAEQTVVKVNVASRAVICLQSYVRSYLLRKKLLQQREIELRPIVLETNDRAILKEALVVTDRLKSKALGVRLMPKLLHYFAAYDNSMSGGPSILSLEQPSTADPGAMETELQFLEQLEFFGVNLIFSTIIKLIDDPVILSSAVDLIIFFGTKAQQMSRKNEKVVYRTLNIGGMSAFCKAALNAYITDAKVCFKFSKLLLLFCNRSELFRTILGEADFVRLICRVLRSFQDDPSVLENMMRVVYEVAVDSSDVRTVLGDNGICAALVDILAMHHTLQRLVNGVCKAICAVCMEGHTNNQTRMLGEPSYAKAFVTAIVANKRNNKINDQIYWCIFSIALNHSLNMHIFAKAGLFHAMAKMLAEDDDNEVIVNQTIWALFKLAPNVKAGYEGIDQKLAKLLQKHAESEHSTTRANATKALRVVFDGIKAKKKEKSASSKSGSIGGDNSAVPSLDLSKATISPSTKGAASDDEVNSPRSDMHAAKLSVIEATHAPALSTKGTPSVPNVRDEQEKKEKKKRDKSSSSSKDSSKKTSSSSKEIANVADLPMGRRLDTKSTNDSIPAPKSDKIENKSIHDVPTSGEPTKKKKKDIAPAPASVPVLVAATEPVSTPVPINPEPMPVAGAVAAKEPPAVLVPELKKVVPDTRRTHKDKSILGESSILSESSIDDASSAGGSVLSTLPGKPEVSSSKKKKKSSRSESPAPATTAASTSTASASASTKKEKVVTIAEILDADDKLGTTATLSADNEKGKDKDKGKDKESASKTSRPQSTNPWSAQQTPRSAASRTRVPSDSANARNANNASRGKEKGSIGEDAFDGGDANAMFAPGGSIEANTFGSRPQHKVGGGPIEAEAEVEGEASLTQEQSGMNASSTSTLSREDAVLILQRSMAQSVNNTLRAKASKSNAGASWVRETALLRIVHSTEDFDILGEALRVASTNSSISLARKAMSRLVELSASFNSDDDADRKSTKKSTKKSSKKAPTGAQSKVQFDAFTKSIKCELLVNVLKLFMTDVAVSEACLMLFAILFKKVAGESAVAEQRRIDGMVDTGALECMMAALKLHDTDAKVCFKCIKTLVSIAELTTPLKTRPVLCTASNIKVWTKIINKHKKNATVTETTLRLIFLLVTENNERSQLVGENNIIASLLTVWQYHAPGNLRVIMTILKLIMALTVGGQTINQEIFGNDLSVKLLVDSVGVCKSSMKMLAASFSAINAVCGKHEPTKTLFFAQGLIEIIMDIIRENTNKDTTILSINFVSRMVRANKNPEEGGGNAPETTRLISLLKNMSEDTDEANVDVRGECIKGLSRIFGRSGTGTSTRGASRGTSA